MPAKLVNWLYSMNGNIQLEFFLPSYLFFWLKIAVTAIRVLTLRITDGQKLTAQFVLPWLQIEITK